MSYQTPPQAEFRPFGTNRFVYVRHSEPKPKVLVNPHFKKKVFINPNFNNGTSQKALPKIHVNPNLTSIHINPNKTNIHVNPNILKKFPSVPNSSAKADIPETAVKKHVQEVLRSTVVSTRTKLIRVPQVKLHGETTRKRRNSTRTKYKIVKSTMPSPRNPTCTSTTSLYNSNRYKVDNTKKHVSTNAVKTIRKRYQYINQFTNISETTKSLLTKRNTKVVKSNKLININGSLYKKSPNSLRKTVDGDKKDSRRSVRKTNSSYKLIRKSKHKLNRLRTSTKVLKISIGGRTVAKRLIKSKGKTLRRDQLRICNIPCAIFRKFGKCKGKDNGACFRKHDPDQIVLCTKFLQGACLVKTCLLSHKVSPEKMPACKYYLEGLCSREDCPYLHVRISPKAEICRYFLEGYCKKAAACDKRHQFLCPDYEKNNNCLKKSCPYPHGNTVRITIAQKCFAKKCSTKKEKSKKFYQKPDNPVVSSPSKFEDDTACSDTKIVKNRYYVEQCSLKGNENLTHIVEKTEDKQNSSCRKCDVTNRPKLGNLPAFISLYNDE